MSLSRWPARTRPPGRDMSWFQSNSSREILNQSQQIAPAMHSSMSMFSQMIPESNSQSQVLNETDLNYLASSLQFDINDLKSRISGNDPVPYYGVALTDINA